mmetsp:Transcript_69816/g.152312  ORF Transcript_69816/g.152312 Transcript_69816/m.152312 type:complete len:95 (-) Transcript_69816:394-678(-)
MVSEPLERQRAAAATSKENNRKAKKRTKQQTQATAKGTEEHIALPRLQIERPATMLGSPSALNALLRCCIRERMARRERQPATSLQLRTWLAVL